MKKKGKLDSVDKAGILFLCVVFSTFLAVYIIKLIMFLLGKDTSIESLSKFSSSAAGMLTGQLLFFTPAFIFIIIQGKEGVKKLRIKLIKPINLLLIPIFVLTLLPVAKVFDMISQLFVDSEIVSTVGNVIDEVPFIIGIVVMAVVPAVFEEVSFRGCIYNNTTELGLLKAACLNGLVFGAMHRNFNQFSYAFVLGTIFSLVVEATDSIVSTMIMHVCINGISYISMYLLKASSVDINKVANEKPTLMNFVIMVPVAILSLAFGGLVYFAMAKVSGRFEYIKEKLINKNKDKKKLRECIPFIVGIIILFAIMLLDVFN